jgi:hypothetical protein
MINKSRLQQIGPSSTKGRVEGRLEVRKDESCRHLEFEDPILERLV